MSGNIITANSNIQILKTIIHEGRWKNNNRFKKKKEQTKKTCLIINPDKLSKELIKKKTFNRKFSYNFWSGSIDIKLIKYLQKNKYDDIIIDKWISDKDLKNFLNLVSFHNVKSNIINIVQFYEQSIGATPVIYNTDLDDSEVFSFIDKPQKSLLITKRVVDVTCVIISLPIVLPVIAFASILTKISSQGPAIFKQNRVGENGRVFTLFKIRTMIHSNNNHQSHTVKDDVRITKLGKFFRKTKIDELPQLWNVLIGDMSLIGPRPERDEIVEKCCLENQFYVLRHIVKPGITGWAQVNNPTATPNENLEKLEFDLYYINNLSWKLELKILLQTIGVVSTMDSL